MEMKGYRENLELLNETFQGRIMLTVDECAAAIGVNSKTVRETIRRVNNPLPSVRVGRRVMIPVARLARWMCIR